LDDIYNVGKTAICETAFTYMNNALADINLSLNIKKCKHLTMSSTTIDKYVPLQDSDINICNFFSIPIVSDGIPVLKVPIGSPAFISTSVSDLLRGYTRISDLVDKFDPDDAFALTSLCINTCPNYLARCVPSSLIEAPLSDFDDRVNKSIASMAGIGSLNDRQKIIRHLPRNRGGLGISSYRYISPQAWISSFSSSLPGIESRFKPIYDLIVQNSYSYVNFDQNLAQPSKQKDRCKTMNEEIYNSLLQSFQPDEQVVKASFISSACHEATNFLFSRYSEVSGAIGLNHFDFQEGLRKHLLISPLINHQHRFCQCHPRDDNFDTYHVFRCHNFAKYWDQRHDLIRDELKILIEKVHGSAVFVSKEQNLTRFKDPNSTHHQVDLRCDLMVTHGSKQYFIDVSVTDPTVKSAIQKGSSNAPLIASGIREKAKHHDYCRYLVPHVHDNIVPFVIESTGRFGKEANKFIDKICQLVQADLTHSDIIQKARWKFMHSVSNILVTAIGCVARSARRVEAGA
jgi:hypothetical protein